MVFFFFFFKVNTKLRIQKSPHPGGFSGQVQSSMIIYSKGGRREKKTVHYIGLGEGEKSGCPLHWPGLDC